MTTEGITPILCGITITYEGADFVVRIAIERFVINAILAREDCAGVISLRLNVAVVRGERPRSTENNAPNVSCFSVTIVQKRGG